MAMSFNDAIRMVREKNVAEESNEKISVVPDPSLGRMYIGSIPDGFRCLGSAHVTGKGADRRGALLWSKTSGAYYLRCDSPDFAMALTTSVVNEAIRRAR